MSAASSFKIAILGGGPAGLTLASLLTASPHDFDFTIFEARGRPDPRDVGVPSGSLDLQEDFGLRSVKACGLYEQFLRFPNECTEQTIICDKRGAVHLDSVGEGRPEISRNALIQLLLSSVPEEKIRWNAKVRAVKPVNASGRWSVELDKGSSSETYDLVVGTDGAWSRARAAIPSAPAPVYSGVISITLDIPDLTGKDPALDKLVGGGTFAACGDGKAVLSQRGVNRSSHIYLFLHSMCQAETAMQLKDSTHDQTGGPDPTLQPDALLAALPTNHKDLQEYLLKDPAMFHTWTEDVKRFLALACEAQPADAKVDARPFYMLPLDPFPQPHMRGVALLGDAAHLMTPFAGKGVNTAMADSYSLAKQLEAVATAAASGASVGEELDKALHTYEEEAHPRGKAAMKLSWMSLLLSYEEGAPTRLAKIMASK